MELNLQEIEMYEPEYFDISEFMGTYNCNWIVFMIQLSLNKRKLETKIYFYIYPRGSIGFWPKWLLI